MPMALASIVKETFVLWFDVNAPRLAAALAYYTTFALAPLLVIVIAVAGLVYGEDAVRGRLDVQIGHLVGPEAAGMIGAMVRSASQPSASILATLIGFVTLLVGATGVFVELQDALNLIWEVPRSKQTGLRQLAKGRLVSFAMVLGIGVLMLASLVLSTALSAVSEAVTSWLPHTQLLVQWLNLGVGFCVTTVLFAMIFKVLPDTKVLWNDVWLGSAITSVLFTMGRFLIGLYLGRSTVSSAYGAAGSLAAVLVWIYYSAQILFLGAEFTHVYSLRRGSKCPDRPQGSPRMPSSHGRGRRRS
jgi:membrane protein